MRLICPLYSFTFFRCIFYIILSINVLRLYPVSVFRRIIAVSTVCFYMIMSIIIFAINVANDRFWKLIDSRTKLLYNDVNRWYLPTPISMIYFPFVSYRVNADIFSMVEIWDSKGGKRTIADVNRQSAQRKTLLLY